MAAASDSVSFWWIALFLLLALGVAAAGVYAVGGTLVDTTAGVLLPPLV